MRTSYVPNEILWGYRFENSCVTYDKGAAKYAINIGNLDKIIPDNTPRYKYLQNLHNNQTITPRFNYRIYMNPIGICCCFVFLFITNFVSDKSPFIVQQLLKTHRSKSKYFWKVAKHVSTLLSKSS